MKVVIYLNHPAHFHLFKNTIHKLKENGHNVIILSKKKDVLDDLLTKSNINYINVYTKERGNSRLSMITSVINRGITQFKIILKAKPDLMIGTAFELAHIGKAIHVPFISVNEDDANVIPLWSKYSYPFASYILSPYSCDNGKWETKTIKYKSYHELAYLHPKVFKPDINVCKQYFNTDKPYFVLRFSGLAAHHDSGIKGINDDLAYKLVKKLEKHGNVFITSERPISKKLEKYRKNINPLDIHHILSFATIYIGDSQTMAAEAGVLGTPFLRFNDFVGRIGYLNELEKKYELGYGFKTHQVDKMFEELENFLLIKNIKAVFNKRKKVMLNDMIELSSFLTWFIQSYPQSVKIMRENPDYQYNFK